MTPLRLEKKGRSEKSYMHLTVHLAMLTCQDTKLGSNHFLIFIKFSNTTAIWKLKSIHFQSRVLRVFHMTQFGGTFSWFKEQTPTDISWKYPKILTSKHRSRQCFKMNRLYENLLWMNIDKIKSKIIKESLKNHQISYLCVLRKVLTSLWDT